MAGKRMTLDEAALYTVKNGKIVDHWDVHAELKDDSKVFVDLDR